MTIITKFAVPMAVMVSVSSCVGLLAPTVAVMPARASNSPYFSRTVPTVNNMPMR